MIFIDACFKKPTPHTPVWIMRQAGRYLSQYMEVRQEAGSFLNLCANPELSTKVTLQPIELLNVDAAILFSDILVLPKEMGLNVDFIKGEGPKIDNSISTSGDVSNLKASCVDKLSYVYDTIKLIKEKLPKEKALIGFAGSPWTIATYMVEGEGSKNYYKIKKMLYSDEDLLKKLLVFNTQMTIEYLERQIKAGVDAIMVFDSWAGMLEPDLFIEYSFDYMLQISSYFKTKYPHIPVILFPKGVYPNLQKIADMKGAFDVMGIDWSVPMADAKKILSPQYVLQGNMESSRLYSKKKIEEAVVRLVEVMRDTPHIFNLGHGVMPNAPVKNVQYFVELVQTLTKR